MKINKLNSCFVSTLRVEFVINRLLDKKKLYFFNRQNGNNH
jgi:hypothetical protein